MKISSLIGGLAFFVAILLSLGGCIEMTQKTRIESDGKCSEMIQVTTNAMFAEGLKNEMKKEDIENKGYKLESKTEGDKVHLIFSREFKNVDEMYKAQRLDPISGMEEKSQASKPKVKGELKVQDLIFVKTMSFKEVTPATEPPAGTKNEQDKQMEEMSKQFAQSMFTFKRVVQMPGPIVSANTKEIDKTTNTATWNVAFDQIQKGCTFEVTSRFINIPAIICALITLVVVMVLVIIALTRKKPETAGQSS